MKVVILAGGYGTRISEESVLKPKPMIEIGEHPILWHIMKLFSFYGYNDFVICLGYKGYVIKEYFANYFLHNSDVTFDIKNNKMMIHKDNSEPWKVTLVDTGENTMTGGRVKRIAEYIKEDEFWLTYGDGLANINLETLHSYYQENKTLACVTAAQPPGRFGALEVKGHKVVGFKEKPKGDGGWINAGFFILSKKIFDYIDGDQTIWERDPLEKVAKEGQLSVFKHEGFWQPMDTLRDKNYLEELWKSGKAPWKLW